MADNLCDVCGPNGKDHDLQSFAVMPEKVAAKAKVINPEAPALCARCRREITAWYRTKIHKGKYDSGGTRLAPLPAEELTG